jgi:hypothetical protein
MRIYVCFGSRNLCEVSFFSTKSMWSFIFIHQITAKESFHATNLCEVSFSTNKNTQIVLNSIPTNLGEVLFYITSFNLLLPLTNFWVLMEIQVSCSCFSGSFKCCHLVFLIQRSLVVFQRSLVVFQCSLSK